MITSLGGERKSASILGQRIAAKAGTIFIVIVCSLTFAVASPAKAETGTGWALLVGVEKYHRAPQLRFTVNDVKQIGTTLRVRGNYKKDNILEITDQSVNPRNQPLKASLLAEIPEFLKQVGAQDRIMIYFSGHGFKGKDGKLYLAPIDCDPANAEATGIPIEWFREQIAGCKAEFKLLVIDACHAGSEKGDDDKDVAAEDFLGSFQGLEKVVTLASSAVDEKSQIWEDKQQSLFSFWLNQGLKGHADKDGDDIVDIDELYNFVFRNVTHTAATRFPRKQTPKRIIRTGVDGSPAVLRVYPQSLKQVLDDMAEQLALDIEERRLEKVGVLEFTNDTKYGEMLGTDYGALGKWCAEELERRLIDRSNRKFTVVDRRRLQTSLSQQGFSVNDLGSSVALKSLSKGVGGMPALVVGSLGNRLRSVVNLQCKVMQTDSDEVIGSAGGSATLRESEWAMLGRSSVVKPEDRRPPGPQDADAPHRPTDELVSHMDQHVLNDPHPLKDPDFSSRFNVYLMVNGKLRPGVYRGNHFLVPLNKGEEYSIYLENNSGQTVLVRLLVDGLNTLPEKSTDTKGIETFEVAPRVNLDQARPWVLDPAKAQKFAVSGFTTETGSQGNWKRFVVDDAEKSMAARRKFTDQLGLITAAFYLEGGGTRATIGTSAGRDEKLDLTERGGVKVGNLIGVVHLRYVAPSELGP